MARRARAGDARLDQAAYADRRVRLGRQPVVFRRNRAASRRLAWDTGLVALSHRAGRAPPSRLARAAERRKQTAPRPVRSFRSMAPRWLSRIAAAECRRLEHDAGRQSGRGGRGNGSGQVVGTAAAPSRLRRRASSINRGSIAPARLSGAGGGRAAIRAVVRPRRLPVNRRRRRRPRRPGNRPAHRWRQSRHAFLSRRRPSPAIRRRRRHSRRHAPRPSIARPAGGSNAIPTAGGDRPG